MKHKGIALGFLTAGVFLLVSCYGGGPLGVPEPRTGLNSSVQTGRQLIASYGCGSCHTIPGVPGADGKAAPPLDHFYERTYIAGRLPNTSDNLMQWIQDPQGVEPGTAMPDLSVTKEEARDIAAYLYHQENLSDLIHR